jgi:Protein of unknown function (DUF3987)
MQRFQILVYPDPPPKRKHTDQYENTEAKNRFYEILKKLAYADFRDYGGLTDEFNKTPWFHFDVPAKEFFEDWQAANEEKTENKKEDPALREHLAKFPKLFCGLSLIFHLIELADTGKRETYSHSASQRWPASGAPVSNLTQGASTRWSKTPPSSRPWRLPTKSPTVPQRPRSKMDSPLVRSSAGNGAASIPTISSMPRLPDWRKLAGSAVSLLHCQKVGSANHSL